MPVEHHLAREGTIASALEVGIVTRSLVVGDGREAAGREKERRRDRAGRRRHVIEYVIPQGIHRAVRDRPEVRSNRIERSTATEGWTAGAGEAESGVHQVERALVAIARQRYLARFDRGLLQMERGTMRHGIGPAHGHGTRRVTRIEHVTDQTREGDVNVNAAARRGRGPRSARQPRATRDRTTLPVRSIRVLLCPQYGSKSGRG